MSDRPTLDLDQSLMLSADPGRMPSFWNTLCYNSANVLVYTVEGLNGQRLDDTSP